MHIPDVAVDDSSMQFILKVKKSILNKCIINKVGHPGYLMDNLKK